MCTVSFVFANGKTIITSNRDEKVLRPSAIEPQKYSINHKEIYFPKDQKAGGTWYAVSENGTVLVLLNGAEEKHQLKTFYRKSRGLIVLDIISSNNQIAFWDSLDLSDIEPFTLVLFQDSKLYQLRWNEIAKETLSLNVTQNHIWSSSTLYSKEIRDKRTNWFNEFLEDNLQINEQELFNFHRHTEEENQEYGLVINRNDSLKTLSITQTVIENNKVVLSHHDLQQQKDFTNTIITI
ncbi:MAG: NRDE family protein [Flavobacterium sp.]